MPQGHQGFASLSDLLQARSGDAEISFCPTAALGSGITEARGNHALLLKPFERSIHASDRGLASGDFFDHFRDRNAIGILAYPEQSQQDNQFKLSELGPRRHFLNYNEETVYLQLLCRPWGLGCRHDIL
jgi:hypothetical protein